jgi:hypothetical protein
MIHAMTARRLIATVVGLVGLVALLIGSFLLGAHSTAHSTAARNNVAARDFMFQVIGVKTHNQGGHTLNLFFHYRYDEGITDKDIPDYTQVRKQALDYLNSVDVSTNPYWEVLNHHLCTQIKTSFPIQAISCDLQVVGVENPPPHDEPGYRSSIETIGDIEPLVVPGPPTP